MSSSPSHARDTTPTWKSYLNMHSLAKRYLARPNKVHDTDAVSTPTQTDSNHGQTKQPPVKSIEPSIALAPNERDWIISGIKDRKDTVEIAEPKMKQNVYIRDCARARVTICLKVNNVVLENCDNVILVVDNVISSIELIRAVKCDVQILGRASAITLDQSSEVNIYASLKSKDVQLACTQISHISLHVPESEEADDEWVEIPIPGQFVHQLKPGTNELVSKVSDLYR